MISGLMMPSSVVAIIVNASMPQSLFRDLASMPQALFRDLGITPVTPAAA